MVNRRSFLGFLGVGAVSGPKMAKTVGMEALEVGNITTIGSMVDAADFYPTSPEGRQSKMECALKQLAKRAKETVFDIEEKRKEQHVHYLTPDVVALRSVSLGHKMRMVRDQMYEAEREKNHKRWTRIVAGMDDDDD
jgi:hypothetical protein